MPSVAQTPPPTTSSQPPHPAFDRLETFGSEGAELASAAHPGAALDSDEAEFIAALNAGANGALLQSNSSSGLSRTQPMPHTPTTTPSASQQSEAHLANAMNALLPAIDAAHGQQAGLPVISEGREAPSVGTTPNPTTMNVVGLTQSSQLSSEHHHAGAHHGVFYADGHVPAPTNVVGLTSNQDHYPMAQHEHKTAVSPNKAYRSPRKVKGRLHTSVFSGGRLARDGVRPPRIKL